MASALSMAIICIPFIFVFTGNYPAYVVEDLKLYI